MDASANAAKLAVLIDADNAQPGIVESLLAEVAKYGTAHAKRAYGDWTGTSLKGWKDQLLKQSIQPIQQFAYTTGKNATDAAMVIDAMDLLYTERFDGFCIVSSDSDFTRLAARIRESGLTVYGFGERKTPKPFVAACDKFIYTENLTYIPSVPQAAGGMPRQTAQAAAGRLRDPGLEDLLRSVVEAASNDDGWAHLGGVGDIIRKRRPDFDPRSYGYPKLMGLMEAIGLFDVDKRDPGDGKPPVIYVRDQRYKDETPGLAPADTQVGVQSVQ
ncbi:NYN domain-containing protein [Streptomyces griseorubiginosus]|uniref:NYN domain-containing protein n=1 Tax=Streptomyces griseorubiginosus TaxID=67304 RepID=UPI003680D20E